MSKGYYADKFSRYAFSNRIVSLEEHYEKSKVISHRTNHRLNFVSNWQVYLLGQNITEPTEASCHNKINRILVAFWAYPKGYMPVSRFQNGAERIQL